METSSSGHEHQAEHGHATRGWLLDLGWRYDLGEWFADRFRLGGALSALRERVLDAADLEHAAGLLDIGCGTGTLAIAAARRRHGALRTAGIDPAPNQIGWARAKARRARLPVDFRQATIERLPFADGTFDRVTSTLMFHHLPPDLKREGLAEVTRVLRPGGLMVVADLKRAADDTDEKGWFEEVPEVLSAAGLVDLDTQEIPFPRFHHKFEGAVVVTGRRP